MKMIDLTLPETFDINLNLSVVMLGNELRMNLSPKNNTNILTN